MYLSKHLQNAAVKKHLYLRKQNISAIHSASQNAGAAHRAQEKFSPIANFILYYLLFFHLLGISTLFIIEEKHKARKIETL